MTLVIVLYALLASTFTLGKAALFYFKPFFFIGLRMVPAGLILLGYLYFFRRERFVFHRKDVWFFLQVILFHIYATFLLEFWALQYLTSSKACLLYNTSPFFAAIFSYFFFKEVLTRKKFVGLLVGFLGFLPIMLTEGPQEASLPEVSFLSTAEIVLLLSVVTSVYGWILMREMVKIRGYSPFMVNGVAMLGGGILSFVTSYIFEANPILATNKVELLTGLTYTGLMIIIANMLFYNLYGYLLHFYSATWLAFVGFIAPLFAALYGWLFLHEHIGWAYFVSMIIVFWGLYLFYREELRQGYITQ
ncbi:EamA family transporter [Candidatus Dependentiae bacterium]|nr:EamA family transporter [Candidatus Dependentiae bacterium]